MKLGRWGALKLQEDELGESGKEWVGHGYEQFQQEAPSSPPFSESLWLKQDSQWPVEQARKKEEIPLTEPQGKLGGKWLGLGYAQLQQEAPSSPQFSVPPSSLLPTQSSIRENSYKKWANSAVGIYFK